MRTTLTIDNELFVAAKKIAAASSSTLSQVVNDYLRLGLSTCTKPPRITPFRMITFRGGRRERYLNHTVCRISGYRSSGSLTRANPRYQYPRLCPQGRMSGIRSLPPVVLGVSHQWKTFRSHSFSGSRVCSGGDAAQISRRPNPRIPSTRLYGSAPGATGLCLALPGTPTLGNRL
jgi:hypothetical protein